MTSTIGAFAVRRDEPDSPLLADSEETLNKAIALHWIGAWEGNGLAGADAVRSALLEERWGDAVLAWMDATGETVDVYPHGLEVHTADRYPDEEFGLHIQTTALFREA